MLSVLLSGLAIRQIDHRRRRIKGVAGMGVFLLIFQLEVSGPDLVSVLQIEIINGFKPLD